MGRIIRSTPLYFDIMDDEAEWWLKDIVKKLNIWKLVLGLFLAVAPAYVIIILHNYSWPVLIGGIVATVGGSYILSCEVINYRKKYILKPEKEKVVLSDTVGLKKISKEEK